MNLLLLSNSTMVGEPYLEYPKPHIAQFLGKKPVCALFIPYAGVTISWNDYAAKVKERFSQIGHDIVSIHTSTNAVKAVEDAEVIVVGGGNTWNLLRCIHDQQLIEPIRKKVLSGTPYIGWSAGANLACPTIKTTNDMPIIDPKGLDALNLVPFQINPHYLDKNPEGHGGETREDRILEFLEINKTTTVVGLREGCMFEVKGNVMGYKGSRSLRVFNYGKQPYELEPSANFNFLIAEMSIK